MINLFLIAWLLCCNEVRLKDKFQEEHKYEVQLFYVNKLFMQPRIELRNKEGAVLVSPVKINEKVIVEHIEFFFSYQNKKDTLSISVNTGVSEWSWSKSGKKRWVRD